MKPTCSLALVAGMLLLLPLGGCARSDRAKARAARLAAEGEPPVGAIRFLCPKDYFGEDLFQRFAEESGAKVHQAVFADEAEFDQKWKDGQGGWDLVLPPQERLIAILKQGQAAPLDREAIPNLKHVDPRLLGPPYDAENRYTVPLVFQPLVALGVRTDHVTKPVKTLDVLFDEQYQGKIGIADDAEQIVGTYLMYVGLPPSATGPEELTRVKELLLKQRPLVRAYAAGSLAEPLRKGEVWLALDHFGNLLDFLHGEEKNIRVVVPETGAPLYVDSLCVVKASPRAEQAQALINYLLRPDVSLKLATDNHLLATVNREAQARLEPRLRENTALYPPAPAHVKTLADWLYRLDRKPQGVEALWKEVRAAKK